MPEWLTQFPYELPIDLDAIDRAIRTFSNTFSGFFGAIKSFLQLMVGGVNSVLAFIPWWLLIVLVFIGGWRTSGKTRRGILYAAMLSLVGLFGMWSLMLETLSIIIVSVIIALILGLPIGILISGSDRADRITRPIWDTMQTMPVYVYLIPAVVLFGLGKAPAVIATTIYAVVPVIRLTNLGIRQVDKEVVEAAQAFGSTKMQALVKVQIPQAAATIMTGINQTLMMAMSMVVTCSLIGASGLGMEVLQGVNRLEMGRGLVAGSCVVIVAVLLDRVTQGASRRKEEQAGDELDK